MRYRALITRLLLIAAFAIAFAYLEAVVVVYLRQLLAKFPHILESWEVVLKKLGAEPLYLIEQFREAATMVMLITFSWLVEKDIWKKLAVFLLAFGIWDIFYYVFLYVLLRWPPSLATIDVYFLIPFPWVGPVFIPVTISLAMIFISLYIFFKKEEILEPERK